MKRHENWLKDITLTITGAIMFVSSMRILWRYITMPYPPPPRSEADFWLSIFMVVGLGLGGFLVANFGGKICARLSQWPV